MMNKMDEYANDLEKKIKEQTRELEEEQLKGELLLYSVMPPWVFCRFTDHVTLLNIPFCFEF